MNKFCRFCKFWQYDSYNGDWYCAYEGDFCIPEKEKEVKI